MKTSHRPDYLSYTVPCPLNAGKMKQVVAFVKHWMNLAEKEASWQWTHFFQTGGSEGFQSSASAGWSRPWVTRVAQATPKGVPTRNGLREKPTPPSVFAREQVRFT